MRKIILLFLLFVFAGTSLFPNYNMKNLSSTTPNDVFELSSASIIDTSDIIGEYPTKGKKLKKSFKAADLNHMNPLDLPIQKNKHLYVSDHTNSILFFLTPCQFQSSYL